MLYQDSSYYIKIVHIISSLKAGIAMGNINNNTRGREGLNQNHWFEAQVAGP